MDADGLAWRNMDHLFLLPHGRCAPPGRVVPSPAAPARASPPERLSPCSFLPPCPARLALPRAYWLDATSATPLSDQLAVVQPHAGTMAALLEQADRTGGFDMDVVNDLYK